MMTFMDGNFLLQTEAARKLYHGFAALMPIYDFHCHINPKDVAENRVFDDLGQLWLEGDHYKWRAMRTAGIPESLITGRETSSRDKFNAWARTVPLTLGNPLYHWTHLELRRPFGLTDITLSPQTADQVWEHCNALLATPEFSARGIMQQMGVSMVGTTDDPADPLIYHRQIAQDESFDIQVLPSWRPDKAFKIEQPGFIAYLATLGAAADVDIRTYPDLLVALERRLDYFAEHGCKAADHGIEVVRYAPPPSEATLTQYLQQRLAGRVLDEQQVSAFSTAVQVWLGQQYAQRGWVMQMHIGAQRNNNSRMFHQLGVDAGFDSIGDKPFAWELAHLLDEMDKTDSLPKTILYCLNPRDNEVLATMVGNFQGGGIAGKLQFGSGWWFNDQKDGMQRQLEQLSQLSLLSQFVGMLTDSRSLLSYTRHEYFRRILCNMVGGWMEQGETPNDLQAMGQLVQDICFNNAVNYFSNRGQG
ncbi:glucuronate isomerase [Aeromonas veronii]|uniref:glucuronate isomerase n=1 Tax=Aeromonas veronii TaxID=654 RepID=UPI003D1CEA10